MEPSRLHTLATSAGIAIDPQADVAVTGDDPVLASRFPVGETAATALAACGVQAARLASIRGAPYQRVDVDVRAAAASLLSFAYMRIDGDVSVKMAGDM